MSKIYNKYIKNIDHTWYESSNIIYSACFDTQDNNGRSVKIVFKGGRTYLYKDVDPIDYVMFRDATSQGTVFNSHIKKYVCEKQTDTDLNELDKIKQKFIESDSLSEYNVHIRFNDKTGEFKVLINDNIVYEGIEGKVSVINLLRSMGIQFTSSETEEHNQTQLDFETNNII